MGGDASSHVAARCDSCPLRVRANSLSCVEGMVFVSRWLEWVSPVSEHGVGWYMDGARLM